MKIMVVDDHILFREGLVNMLGSQPDLVVVGEAGSVSEAVAQARQLKPDLILLDYSLPDGSGPYAARLIHTELPQTKIVFLTIHDSVTYLVAAIRSGAVGYLVKNMPFAKLLVSIRAIANNEPAITRKMTLSLMQELARPSHSQDAWSADLAELTLREVEILRFLVMDASNQEIAEHFSISVSTVKSNLHDIFRKLNLKNRKEVASFARRQGLGKNV
jgi:DNA-binding NarL/FixJ family response regulator